MLIALIKGAANILLFLFAHIYGIAPFPRAYRSVEEKKTEWEGKEKTEEDRGTESDVQKE